MSDETMLGREIGARVSVIVVAGVSGSGKSTVGEALGRALGWPYRDADTFHPPANIEKMSRGVPLTDADRAPWLAAIAHSIAETCARGAHAIVSCSALKRAYRATLIGAHPGRVRIVLLDGSEAEIATRLAARKGHFMPAALLHSQFAALERPAADAPNTVLTSIDGSVEEILRRVIEAMRV